MVEQNWASWGHSDTEPRPSSMNTYDDDVQLGDVFATANGVIEQCAAGAFERL
jgi:hypothetical protein